VPRNNTEDRAAVVGGGGGGRWEYEDDVVVIRALQRGICEALTNDLRTSSTKGCSIWEPYGRALDRDGRVRSFMHWLLHCRCISLESSRDRCITNRPTNEI